jgi:argininosuccinate synthase
MIKKVVHAYSGGLDTSVIIPWQRIISVKLLLQRRRPGGELHGLLKALRRALQVVRRGFARRVCARPHLAPFGPAPSSAVLLGTSMARPTAKRRVEIALREAQTLCSWLHRQVMIRCALS